MRTSTPTLAFLVAAAAWGCLSDTSPGTTTTPATVASPACVIGAVHALPSVTGDCRWSPSVAAADDGRQRVRWGLSFPETCFGATAASDGSWTDDAARVNCAEPQVVSGMGGFVDIEGGCLAIRTSNAAVALDAGCYGSGARAAAVDAKGALWVLAGAPGNDRQMVFGPVVDGRAQLSPHPTHPEGSPADIAAGSDGPWLTYSAAGETYVDPPLGEPEPISAIVGGYVKQTEVGSDGALFVLAEHRSDHGKFFVSRRDTDGTWSTLPLPAPDPHWGSCPASAKVGDTCSYATTRYDAPTLVPMPDGVWVVARKLDAAGSARYRCDLQSAAPPPHNTYCDWDDADREPVTRLAVAVVTSDEAVFRPVAELPASPAPGGWWRFGATSTGQSSLAVVRSGGDNTCGAQVLQLTCSGLK